MRARIAYREFEMGNRQKFFAHVLCPFNPSIHNQLRRNRLILAFVGSTAAHLSPWSVGLCVGRSDGGRRTKSLDRAGRYSIPRVAAVAVGAALRLQAKLVSLSLSLSLSLSPFSLVVLRVCHAFTSRCAERKARATEVEESERRQE